jgi:NTE family protein
VTLPPAPTRRRWLGVATAACAATLLGGTAGCTLAPDADHEGDDAPAAGPLARTPRTAWVFSSGGPRGYVHVGVLKALDELGLAPDLIVGASVGALVGVLRAGGLTAAEIEAIALELQPWELARLANPLSATPGRLSGAPLAEFVRQRLGGRPLQALQPAAVCVAQRLEDGSVVAFSRGDAGLAVQAAAAIEGQFTPVRIRGQRHADADLRMPLPVRVARALGATRVLAVDASAHEERAPPGAEHYRESDVAKRALTRPDAELADLLLHPDFGYWVSLSREYRERSIAAGYRDAMAAAKDLRALHAA